MTPSGMINNVSEYQLVKGADIDSSHPHGDLDRIIINGGIMPLRDDNLNPSNPTNWKKCLRGEDIAFLKEANCERYNAMTAVYGGTRTDQFSRKISRSQVDNTCYIITELFRRSGDGLWDTAWIKDGVYPTSRVALDSSSIGNDAFLEAYQGYYYTLSDAQTTEYPTQDGILRRSTIETMFSDISKLYYLSMWHIPHGDDYVFYNDGTTPEYSSSVAIEFPTNQYISRFENYGIGAFRVHYWKSDPAVNKSVLIPMSLSSPLSPRDIAATAFSLIGISDYEASGVISWVDGSVRGYFGELRSRTRWT